MSFKHVHSTRNCKTKKSFTAQTPSTIYTPAITYYELLELEKEKLNETQSVKVKIKRNFPIAPDGFIPNSVVRKFFRIFDEKVSEKKVWKLKWKAPELRREKSQNTLVENQIDEMYLGSSSEEENVEEEHEKTETVQNVEYDDPDKVLKDILKRLKNFEWFKFNNDATLGNLIKYLINKLISRDPSNHSDISTFLIEIKNKLRLTTDQSNWVQSQLEEELDATDLEILENNIRLIPIFCTENYVIDQQLLNVLESKTFPDGIKTSAMETLCTITDLETNNIQFVLGYLKKLSIPKYKKMDNFNLKKFIEEIELENQLEYERKNRVYNVDEETNSDLFKHLQKEDWIPNGVKEDLKTLKDYMTFILKSLKSVKSIIFYEKLCNYLKSLFDEFKLVNTHWEGDIIKNLIHNNYDWKASDPLRSIDIENLGKYLQSTQEKGVREDILSELLRSATFEKHRPNTMNIAREILTKVISQADLDALIKFCGSKNFKIGWSDALHYYKSRPDITSDEFKEIKGSIIVLRNLKSASKSQGSSKKSNDTKKSKKSSKKDKSDSDDKSEKRAKKKEKKKEQADIIRERTEVSTEKSFVKTPKKSKKTDEHQFHLSEISNETKSEITTDYRLPKNVPSKTDDKSEERIASNLLPNNVKTWDSYQKRNDDLILKKALTFDPIQNEENHEDHDEDHGEFDFDTIKLYSSSDTNPKDSRLSLDREDTEQIKKAKDSKEILEGITKRVIIADGQHLKKLSNEQFLRKYNSMDQGEKGHFIEPVDLKSNFDNFKFRKSSFNKKLREFEDNQLLECLIIRGLDLHKHYEKLLPQNMSRNESFVPIPYFKDFLVVHPINAKTSLKQMTSLDLKKPTTPVATNFDSINDNYNLNAASNLYPIRKINNRNLRKRYPCGQETAKITDMELNHLFLINKLLISYDAQNLNHFYRTINSDFKNYLNRLHSRIPTRIVPLIWNDPVMQKLALVVSTSKNFKQKIAHVETEQKKEPQVHNILYNDPKLELRQSNLAQKRQSLGLRRNYNQPPKLETSKTTLSQWSMYKPEENLRSRMLRKRFYLHLMNLKYDYMKLQWRYMVSSNQSTDLAPRRAKSFLPPLSYKAQLFYPPNTTFN